MGFLGPLLTATTIIAAVFKAPAVFTSCFSPHSVWHRHFYFQCSPLFCLGNSVQGDLKPLLCGSQPKISTNNIKIHQAIRKASTNSIYTFWWSEAPQAQMCLLVWWDSPAPQSGPSWWPSANKGKKNDRLKERNPEWGPQNIQLLRITLQRRPADTTSRNPAQMC